MPVSSLILQARSEGAVSSIVQEIDPIKSAKVEKVTGTQIVVVTETNTRSEDEPLYKKLEALPGVIQCDLIYCNFEDVEEDL